METPITSSFSEEIDMKYQGFHIVIEDNDENKEVIKELISGTNRINGFRIHSIFTAKSKENAIRRFRKDIPVLRKDKVK